MQVNPELPRLRLAPSLQEGADLGDRSARVPATECERSLCADRWERRIQRRAKRRVGLAGAQLPERAHGRNLNVYVLICDGIADELSDMVASAIARACTTALRVRGSPLCKPRLSTSTAPLDARRDKT